MSGHYHYRVTAKWDEIEKGLITEYLSKFKPLIYCFSEEVSKQGVVHVHGHLFYDLREPATSTVSDLHKKYKLSGKYYHQRVRGEWENNLIYVMKDLNIKKYDMPEEAYNKYMSKTIEINEDKKKDTRHKLFELYRAWFDEVRPKCDYMRVITNDFGDEIEENEFEVTEFGPFLNQMETIALFINDLYVNKWDKEPPLSHLSGYVLYIATKMNQLYKPHNTNDSGQYYSVRYFYQRRFD